jgi:hypothetical protein
MPTHTETPTLEPPTGPAGRARAAAAPAQSAPRLPSPGSSTRRKSAPSRHRDEAGERLAEERVRETSRLSQARGKPEGRICAQDLLLLDPADPATDPAGSGAPSSRISARAPRGQAAADLEGAPERTRIANCEDCQLKRPTFGLPAEGKVRWCFGCAKAHTGAADVSSSSGTELGMPSVKGGAGAGAGGNFLCLGAPLLLFRWRVVCGAAWATVQ